MTSENHSFLSRKRLNITENEFEYNFSRPPSGAEGSKVVSKIYTQSVLICATPFKICAKRPFSWESETPCTGDGEMLTSYFLVTKVVSKICVQFVLICVVNPSIYAFSHFLEKVLPLLGYLFLSSNMVSLCCV